MEWDAPSQHEPPPLPDILVRISHYRQMTLLGGSITIRTNPYINNSSDVKKKIKVGESGGINLRGTTFVWETSLRESVDTAAEVFPDIILDSSASVGS